MARRTPLYDEHVKLKGKIVEFCGWEMPIQYTGVIDEHETIRKNVGLFDVSHMGQFDITGPDAMACAQYLTTNDVSALVNGQAVYSIFCNEQGTVVDDVIVYRYSPEHIMFVVNAANIDKDFAWVTSHKKGNCEIANNSDNYGLIAVQGPKAAETLQKITDTKISDIKTFHFTPATLAGVKDCLIARTGYTGEDGFELFSTPATAPKIWSELLKAGAAFNIKPCGLGARDTLRLEMKYSLYGHEITDKTNPLEAGLSWVVKIDKPSDFIGRDALIRVKEAGLKRKLVGFELKDPGIPRDGFTIKIDHKPAGFVTSGTMSPSLKKSIGTGYVPVEHSAIGSKIYIDIRGTERLAEIVKTPFYKKDKQA
jgi:aminomethyltransferase